MKAIVCPSGDHRGFADRVIMGTRSSGTFPAALVFERDRWVSRMSLESGAGKSLLQMARPIVASPPTNTTRACTRADGMGAALRLMGLAAGVGGVGVPAN